VSSPIHHENGCSIVTGNVSCREGVKRS